MANDDNRRLDNDMEEINGRADDDSDDERENELPMDEEEGEILADEDNWVNYESGDDDTVVDDENAEQFDVTLPSRHAYLGETQELRGRTVQDENDYVTIPLLHDNNLLMNLVLVPTQTLPMTVFHPLNISMLRNVIDKDRTFGIVHTKYIEGGGSEMAEYGTTAEIYEYQEEEGTGALSIKAKGRQRFKLISTRREMTGLVVAQVKILPEIRMENPFKMMRLQSLDKMVLSPAVEAAKVPHAACLDEVRTPKFWHVRRKNAWLTPWPSWVYNQYDDLLLTRKVIDELKKSTMLQPHLLKVPSDPQELSHWAAINLPLHDSHRLTLLSLNTPTQRLRYILSVLSKVCLDSGFMWALPKSHGLEIYGNKTKTQASEVLRTDSEKCASQIS
ncbi:protein cereblon-like isoform X2 [Palaemon carinicauda]|uniref:protein cereblon-like isoform X2 n=1 Tax=Palaemon carinicauda TaxID=392227 RepID=UPI0035B6640E